MKKHILLTILLPFIGLSQSYTITQQPTYGQDPKYTPTTYKVNQTSTTTAPNVDFGAMTSRAIDTYNQRAAAQAAINENRRIENERQQREYLEKNRLIELEKKKLQEDKRLEEEKDPNSILNKFKSSKLKKENEDLKMEMILAEKEKAEKEKAEIDRLEKERIERENSLKKKFKNK
jgi:hypothetical protein